MRTLMVLRDSSGFPPDIRIQKEAKSLLADGIKVSLLCCMKEGQLDQEDVGGIDVRRIKLPNEYTKGLAYWLIRAGVSSHEHPYWAWAIEKMAVAVKADVLHIHDLPLVDTAIKVGKSLHIPVIADLHEFYPEAIRVHYGWRGQAICSIGRWEAREKRALYKPAFAFTISPQGLDYYRRKYGLPRNQRVRVVGNYVDLRRFDSLPIDQSILGQYQNGHTIAYLGSYGIHRGIEGLVNAMKLVVREIPDARLVLVGPHPEAKLKKLVSPMLWERITVTGFVDDALFPSYMKAADVLVHPLVVNSPQTNYCCPHKIFQYMAARKPIVASRTESFQHYIEQTNAGMLVKTGDIKMLATYIVRLLNDKKLSQWFGDNGRKAVETTYNWQNEGKKLTGAYWSL